MFSRRSLSSQERDLQLQKYVKYRKKEQLFAGKFPDYV